VLGDEIEDGPRPFGSGKEMSGTRHPKQSRPTNLRREVLTELDGHHDVVASVNHECGKRNAACAASRIEAVEGVLLARKSVEYLRG
jgi:hypothetical protein